MNRSMLGRRFGGVRTGRPVDPLLMLKEDHRKVKALFDEFEKSESEAAQLQVAKRAIRELRLHSAVEEEIFYPAVRGMIDDVRVIAEAFEEHHVFHLLIGELERGDLVPEVFHAKFKVLAESVRHHIADEEGTLMPMIDAEKSELHEIGARMVVRKEELEDELDLRSSRSSLPPQQKPQPPLRRGPNGGAGRPNGGARPTPRPAEPQRGRPKGRRPSSHTH